MSMDIAGSDRSRDRGEQSQTPDVVVREISQDSGESL
jgi:hypothetical protein